MAARVRHNITPPWGVAPPQLLALKQLSGADKVVALTLLRYAMMKRAPGMEHTQFMQAWPGMKCLQENTGLGRSTIYQSLERLAELGLIKCTNRSETGTPNLYELAGMQAALDKLMPLSELGLASEEED